MSFSIEFYAKTKEAALAKVDKEHAPDCVKAFLVQGIQGCPPLTDNAAMYVKAVGHLCHGDYEVSNADIRVTPIRFAG